MSTPAGIFYRAYRITTGLPGAPTLNAHFIGNPATKAISGQSHATQAISPPLDLHDNLYGEFTYMTVMPKKTHILVTASGTPAIQWPRHAGIGPVLLPNLELRMVLEEDWSRGVANWKYQGADGQWHEFDNVPVEAVRSEL